ncbi:MAG: type II toxin-antitoxin system RelE/ParE family toxin, partial [Chloroflexi bacterium]
LFGLRVGRHIVFYRKIQFEGKEIEITRILHERMDLKNRVKE